MRHGEEVIKLQLVKRLNANVIQPIHLIGRSAGASSVYNAVKDFLQEYPELIQKFREYVSLEFWGSPEYKENMQSLSQYCSVKIWNREHDYIADSFEQPLWDGIALPFALWKVFSDILHFGNQHRAILYLRDYEYNHL